MSVTPQDIRDLPSGEFTALSDGAIQPFLDEAGREVNASIFGERSDDATKYLAAHLIATMTGGSNGAAGPVISETAGQLSRSYAAQEMSGDSVEATTYGRRYAQIRQLVAGGPRAL